MNKTIKIFYTVICIVLLISLSACISNTPIFTNSEKVSQIAFDIADFNLPEGYYTDFGAKFKGYSIAAFNQGNGQSHIYLIQSEKESDAEKLEKMLIEMVPNSRDSQTRMTVIENRPAMVRGQNVTLVISEGVNAEGNSYRQVTTAFNGKGGPAFLVLSESVTQWDQAAVDNFLTSIK
jgi:hypothetical protein